MRSCCQCVMVVTNLLLYNFTTHLIFCSINFTALQIKKQTWTLSSWSCDWTFWHKVEISTEKNLSSSLCWLLAHSDLVFTSTLRGDRIPSPPSLAFQTWDHSRPENTHTYFEVSPLHLMFGSSINETTSQYLLKDWKSWNKNKRVCLVNGNLFDDCGEREWERILCCEARSGDHKSYSHNEYTSWTRGKQIGAIWQVRGLATLCWGKWQKIVLCLVLHLPYYIVGIMQNLSTL